MNSGGGADSSGPGGARVLVVDDNETNSELLKLKLELRGYDVQVADSGASALTLLSPDAGGDVFDAVLLDIMMPEISGLDVLRQIRPHRGVDELPIIMTTARDQSDDVVEALQLGANDYVTKPIDFPVLLARLDTQLRVKRLAAQRKEFMAIASHDLKNPLAVIRGFAKVVYDLQPEGSEMNVESRELLERIVQQTKTMERIVGDYLDFQALDEGRLAIAADLIDLVAIAKGVTGDLQNSAAAKEIKLNTEILGTATARVVGDQLRIRQILENLVGNAIKFSKSGAEVGVKVESGAPWKCDHCLAEAGATVNEGARGTQVEVQDSGPGIPEIDSTRLFVKYARLSNRPTGGEKSSGLGLAICKRLIEMHGGRIGVRNNEGRKGSTFLFWVPGA